MYGQQVVASPVTNPVIYGRFPKHVVRTSSAEKLNKILSMMLLGLVVLSLVSYYFVSDGEKTMNSLGREIVSLTNENIELQNKIDNLHSFNRVDTLIQGRTSLDTAKKVIEIPAVNMVEDTKLSTIPVNYNWSIGY
jgi:predicted hydrocarbon binding protein